MNKELEDRIYDAAEKALFTTVFGKDYVRFEAHSLCGEDVSFEVYADDFDDILSEVKSNYEFFDIEEHAVMWWHTHGEKGAPKELELLLFDAQSIKHMYRVLYMQMCNLKKELEEE